VDELEDFEASIGCSLCEGGFLLVAEVGWDGNDGRIDGLSSIVGGRLSKTAEMTSGNLGDGNCRFLIALLVVDLECDCVFMGEWVGRSVAVGGVYRLEAISMYQYQLLQPVLKLSYSCPR